MDCGARDTDVLVEAAPWALDEVTVLLGVGYEPADHADARVDRAR
jgi:hypothetical protein